MGRRIIILALGLLLIGCTSQSVQPRSLGTTTSTSQESSGDQESVTLINKVHCGYERWTIKTGTDKAASQVKLQSQPSTITAEIALKSPLPKVTGKYPPQTPRQPLEEQVISLHDYLINFHIEQDNDLHLVLADSAKPPYHTMIAEIPNPLCVGSTSPFKAAINQARVAFTNHFNYHVLAPCPKCAPTPFVQVDQPVTVSGVRFFDFVHGQLGVAPNGVEVHPVLNILFQ